MIDAAALRRLVERAVAQGIILSHGYVPETWRVQIEKAVAIVLAEAGATTGAGQPESTEPGHDPRGALAKPSPASGPALDAERRVIEAAQEWRELRREYSEALSASVQARHADLGRPPGFSAWNEDEQKRHNWLLGEMLVKLNALERAIDERDAERERRER